MPKLTLMRGLPASGKTTKARELVKASGSAARINRDDLRAMLFNSSWSGKREEIIIAAEKALVAVLAKHNHNAIIDDTNLSTKHVDMWRNVAKETYGENSFVIESLLDVPRYECVRRDHARQFDHDSKFVGRAVIDRMALANDLIDWNNRPIILVDIDGTLADGTHRQHYVTRPEGEKKDWDSYYEALSYDEPISFVMRWVRKLAEDHTICLVSGRPDTYQRETMNWLIKWAVPYDYLFMRSGGDHRPDTEVKAKILKHIPRDLLQFVIDDRPQVIRMWRENGVKVYPVRGACDEF